MGSKNPSDLHTSKASDKCTIMYTSDTSGDPKGVILTHDNAVTNIRGVDLFMEQFEDKMTVDDVYLSFLPLAHILDRIIEEYFFRNGASIGFFHGNINELRDDMMELRPTFLAGVPRVLERIHEGEPAIERLFELSSFNPKVIEDINEVDLESVTGDVKFSYSTNWIFISKMERQLLLLGLQGRKNHTCKVASSSLSSSKWSYFHRQP
ncbi:hypothetical protein L1887_38306 [Cichorium endivia]|nr:hypothetical protein L1887_38306 [Cichorium endivia]